jgi:hypothetical protein
MIKVVQESDLYYFIPLGSKLSQRYRYCLIKSDPGIFQYERKPLEKRLNKLLGKGIFFYVGRFGNDREIYLQNLLFPWFRMKIQA